MKATILLLTLSSAMALVTSMGLGGLDPQLVTKIMRNVHKCTQKYGTTTGDLIKMMWEMSLPKTQEMKCTIDCYLIENGYIKDGKLDWAAIRAEGSHITYNGPEREKAEEVADACQAKAMAENPGECELGSSLLKCAYEESKKLGINPADLMKVIHKSGQG